MLGSLRGGTRAVLHWSQFLVTLQAIDPALDFLEDSLDAPPAVDGDEPLAPPADTSAGDTGDIAASTNRDSQQQPQAASVGGGGGGGGKNGTRIALIAVFGTLFPLILVALAVWVVHRRHSRREAWAEFNDGLPKVRVVALTASSCASGAVVLRMLLL